MGDVMLKRVEDVNQLLWGDKVTLATTAHTVGGLGLGLLIGGAERYRFVGYLLLAFALLAHAYAFLTMRTGTQAHAPA